MNDVGGVHVHHIDLAHTAPGTIGKYWLHVVNNSLGEAIRVPILVARGKHDGPVFGLTAAIHGNELNGIPVIQQLFRGLDVSSLRGTILAALVVNVPGLVREQRVFNDGADLNRIAPGDPAGTTSQVYIHRIVQRVIRHFNYHVDLHTASFGRVNSHYVRADMTDPKTARLARLQNPQIIVNNHASDRTLRGAASEMGITSVTVELRDPHVFQRTVVTDGITGLNNALFDLGMLEGEISCPVERTVVCQSSRWLYTDEGGILSVFPKVCDYVKAGQPIAEVRTIFGEVTKRYSCPEDAIVVGRSVNPLNQTGSRIVHLGTGCEEIPCVTEAED